MSGPKPGWFERQMRSVEEEVATWPNWKRRAAGLEEKPMTDEEFGRAYAAQMGWTPGKSVWSDQWFWGTQYSDGVNDRHRLPSPLLIVVGRDKMGMFYADTEAECYAALGRAVRAVHEAVPHLKATP